MVDLESQEKEVLIRILLTPIVNILDGTSWNIHFSKLAVFDGQLQKMQQFQLEREKIVPPWIAKKTQRPPNLHGLRGLICYGFPKEVKLARNPPP